jgi:hypothetical protein
VALHIDRPGAQAPGTAITSDRRLWLTKQGDRLVEDGSPEAAVLFAAPGTPVLVEDMARLGLVAEDGVIVLPETKMAAEPENKMAPAPANKGRKRGSK